MAQRYFVELSFKGTRYHGWQIQPNAESVQSVLERTFSVFLRREIALTGAGRTDSGVHATCFVAHFETDSLPFQPADLVHKLNRFLPPDISLHRIWPVPDEAHARFSALSRTYRYVINRCKDPFSTETGYTYLLPLDVEKMNEAAAVLLRYTDFTSFSRLHSDTKTNICRIYSACWEEKDGQLVFTIRADRFLRNMVRAVVGTLLEVGKGKLSVADVAAIIEKQDRCAAGASAPPHGLFLTAVEYPGNCAPPASDGIARSPGSCFPSI